MASIYLNVLFLLQLSSLLLSGLPVLGSYSFLMGNVAQVESDRHHPPVHPPAEAPDHHPKTHPPDHPLVHHHHHHHHNHSHKHNHTHHHANPPVQSPVQPPTHPPVNPPAQRPVHPPNHAPGPNYPVPKRKMVAVQGVVYCKPCKYTGVDTLLGASPLLGAVVKLQCNNTKYPLVQKAKTDKNGYFFIEAAKSLTTFGSHKCLVSLLSSPPAANCSKPTNLHAGEKGAMLMPRAPDHSSHPLPYELFTVGPFAFEPPAKCSS